MAGTLAVRPSATQVRRQLPAVRVRPVPPLEPPTDDERLAAGIDDPVPGMPELPLEFPVRTRGRVTGLAPAEAVRVRRATALGSATALGAINELGSPTEPVSIANEDAATPLAAPTATSDGLPPTVLPARLAVRRFLNACVEV